jgi:hypothetical protein
MILGAAVVLGLAALQWREIAVRWRVARLEGDESSAQFKSELVLQPQGTVGYEALVRYARTPKGKEGLLRRYIALVDNHFIRQLIDGLGAGGENAFLLLWVGRKLSIEVGSWADLPGGAVDTGEEDEGPSPSVPRPVYPGLKLKDTMPSLDLAHHLQDLLLEVGYDEYPLPERPGARFSVVSCGQPDPRCARRFPSPLLGGRHACLFESETYRYDLPANPGGVSIDIEGGALSR